ncbi:lysosomal acid phosphatase-like [Lytechinus variegatus]|uniref:lysosomal acid phosphatase-like n=1 Tax=Lytechinus variegatus TaxID=7654 RepID=UPI001BB1097F|nr:lysosomal acid phosphatase-like [Lytechinus variegatus]
MSFLSSIHFISLALFIVISGAMSESTLRLVNVLYRHGDRSPAETFPNDPYQENSWPQGWGQLSKLGMQMQYGLGQFLGKMYQESGFLNTNYTRPEINVRSTDVDRCLMSAESNLAGLYPPLAEMRFNPNISWQPIPVHTIPKEDDYLLRADGTPCPYYDELYAKELEDDRVKEINTENKDFFEMLKNNTGVTYDVTLSTVYKIEDPLFCEQAHGRTLPTWATDEVLLKLENLTNIGMAMLFGTKELARLKGGPLVGKMIADMEEKSKNVTGIPAKFYMYSAHDTTLAAFMSALGVYNGKQSPYASAVGVELWEDEDTKSFNISMWFRNSTDQKVPFTLQLKGCSDMCGLERFKELLKDVVPLNVEAECGATYKKNYTIPILIGTSIIALILLLIFLFLICKGRQQETKEGHRRLQQDVEA